MKKYILISLVLHLIILFGFGVMQTAQLGKDEPKNQVVPIAFVAKQTSENPGGKVLDTEEREKQSPEPPKPKVEKKPEEKKPEEKKVEKKPEKKEIESNIPSKDAKLVEKQPETTTSENTQSTESTDKVESTPSDNNSSSGGGNTSSTGSGDEGFGSNFISDGDGSYIALSSKGINYQIINEVEPDYPSQAESIGYSKQVKVTVKFLVGLKGNVEKAEITQSHKDLGFDAEVMKAIKKWKFKPIYYNGKNIKVYFVKTFVFDPQ
ncbi:energy transducer TonB [Fusobacterium nucleatum]|uniref:energy transducer TonB n=1 Tax=Fusobacterium nucleatum TaxID=851 RepID=UPI0003F91ADA|nr:energy transducer TonB [Fusobacterium nucleatum]ALF24684.1 energy transducer TonB [Fusobacterium nucleatum subsp. nucleatum ChDC F316]